MERLVMAIIMIAITQIAFAQQFYSKLSVGYGFPLNAQHIGSNSSYSFTTTRDPESGDQIPRVQSKEEVVFGSYGAGFNAQISFGYMFSEYVGIEAAFGYFKGKEYETVRTDLDSRLEDILYLWRDTDISYGRGFTFAPMLKLVSGNSTISPYLMIGPLLGKVEFFEESNHFNDDEGEISTEETLTHFTGGISIGSRAVAGMDWKVGESINIFLEVTFNQMNFYPKESTLEVYRIDGEDELSTLPANYRKRTYGSTTGYDSQGGNSSENELAFNVVMSSMSVNTGIKYVFGK